MAVEPEIIAGCKKGKKSAIKSLYQSTSGWMLGVALRYIKDRNEAMSIVNTAILSALKTIKNFEQRNEKSFEAWLKTILIRKIIDYQRKSSTEASVFDLNEYQTSNGVAYNEGISNRRQEELIKLINKLPKKTKTVFNLYAIEGFKHKEIAEMLSISEGTSKWHLNEARTKLQDMVLKMDEYKMDRI